MKLIALLLFSSWLNADPVVGPEFVDLSKHPLVQLDIRYATTGNFTGKNLYGTWKKCYLPAEAAKKFERAASELRTKKLGWKFLVFDCLRPRSVQRVLWDVVKVPQTNST